MQLTQALRKFLGVHGTGVRTSAGPCFAESIQGRPLCLPDKEGAWNSLIISGIAGTGTVQLSLFFAEEQISQGKDIIFFDDKDDFALRSRLRAMAEEAGRAADFITIELSAEGQLSAELQEAATSLTKGYLKKQIIYVSIPTLGRSEQTTRWERGLHLALIEAVRSVISGTAKKPVRTQVYINPKNMEESSLSLLLELGRAADTHFTFISPSLDMIDTKKLRLILGNVPVGIFLRQSGEGLKILAEALGLEGNAAELAHLASERRTALIFKNGSQITQGWLSKQPVH